MSEINRLVKEAAKRLEAVGIERPIFEAQLLLGLALGATRLEVLRGPSSAPTDEQSRRFNDLVSRREQRVPLAYLRATQEFYGLEFEVTPAVLVPRPETELLVDFARERLPDLPGRMLVDVGTGSGCIAVAAAVHLTRARAVAVDLSEEALKIARRNAECHGVSRRILCLRADMLSGIRERTADLILSNPPYIPSVDVEELQPEVRDHEPRMALDGGPDGLGFHRQLIAGSIRVLKSGGCLGIEVAAGQAHIVEELLRDSEFEQVETKKDLAGIGRMVSGQWMKETSYR
jgi:release factor glutamine methyltransferase